MNTRNLITILFIALLATSCTTVKQTARMEDPTSYINTVTIADLEVSEQSITFTYTPSKAVVNGGRNNVIKTAVAEALRKANRLDLIGFGKDCLIRPKNNNQNVYKVNKQTNKQFDENTNKGNGQKDKQTKNKKVFKKEPRYDKINKRKPK